MHGGVADRRELQVVHPGFRDHVEAPEGEEDVDLDTFPSAALASTSAGYAMSRLPFEQMKTM